MLAGMIALLPLALPAVDLPERRDEPSLLPGSRAAAHSPEQVRRLLARRLSPAELRGLEIPYAADDRIRDLAFAVTRGAHGERRKLRALRSWFRRQGYLARYDRGFTRSARQVAAGERGNCQSYANLFVAMARTVGLRAHYLDASAAHSQTERSGSVLVQWGHVLVGVQIGPDWIAVDFDGRAGRPQRFRVIGDLEAIADFYNNLGAERAWRHRHQGGFGSAPALAAFRIATRVAPGFARAWNNLGVALGRAGRTDAARRAYRRALRAEPRLHAAWANLGQLLRRQGHSATARRALQRAVELAPRQAHYRYYLGRLLAESGRIEAAITELERGTTLDPEMFQLHLLLSEIHAERGDRAAALRAARRVLELAPGQRDATRLLRKDKNSL
jgi:tetratricopeptide (TPR) repeat protein